MAPKATKNVAGKARAPSKTAKAAKTGQSTRAVNRSPKETRIRFEITPYERVGPITFQMTKQEVRQQCRTMKISADDRVEQDPEVMAVAKDFIGKENAIQVEYDRSGLCCSVGISLPARAEFSGQSLSELSFRELRSVLKRLDPSSRFSPEDSSVFLSPGLGLSAYVPDAEEDPEKPAEQIFCYTRGYYEYGN